MSDHTTHAPGFQAEGSEHSVPAAEPDEGFQAEGGEHADPAPEPVRKAAPRLQ